MLRSYGYPYTSSGCNDGEDMLDACAAKKKAHRRRGMKRLLFTILAAGLALIWFNGACHAIVWSWDYTKYRVKVYIKGGELGVSDENRTDRLGVKNWLIYPGPERDYPKYELIAQGPMIGYEWPPSQVAPVDGVANSWEGKLKYGDVIICDDHEGFVQPNGTIAHFLRPVPVEFQYDVHGLPQHWCPDPNKAHEYGKSPGWRKDPNYPNDTKRDHMSCAGEFKGDTWKEFLARSGNPKLPGACVRFIGRGILTGTRSLTGQTNAPPLPQAS